MVTSPDAAVFVDDDTHVLLFALHLAQQLVDALGFRNKLGLARDAGDGTGAGLGVGDLQQVWAKAIPLMLSMDSS